MKDLKKTLTYYRDLFSILLSKELKVRYKNTFLGYVWSILHPLLFAGVYIFVFQFIFKITIPNYPLFLICGLFPWQAFANSLGTSTMTFIGNSSLIKRVPFPRELLVYTVVLNDMIHFILSSPVIILLMIYYGVPFNIISFLFIPLLLLIQYFFTVGISLIFATCNLFLRDLERLISILTLVWFFMTPVIFSESYIPAAYKWILYINPMASIILLWKNIFMSTPIDMLYLSIAFAWSIVTFSIGYLIYRKFRWRFAELV